jgi:hypothetical protein
MQRPCPKRYSIAGITAAPVPCQDVARGKGQRKDQKHRQGRCCGRPIRTSAASAPLHEHIGVLATAGRIVKIDEATVSPTADHTPVPSSHSSFCIAKRRAATAPGSSLPFPSSFQPGYPNAGPRSRSPRSRPPQPRRHARLARARPTSQLALTITSRDLGPSNSVSGLTSPNGCHRSLRSKLK